MGSDNPKTEDTRESFVREAMRFLDGLSTPEEFEHLQRQLRDSADSRRLYVDLCLQARAMAEGLATQELVGSALTDESLEDEEPDVFLEVIEQALRAREIHAIEDRANRQLAEDLRRQHAETQRLRMSRPPTQPSPRVIVIPKAVAYLGVGLVAALLMFTIYLVAAPDPPASRGVSPLAEAAPDTPVRPGEPRYVAELVRVSQDAAWTDQSAGWAAGMRLEAGEIDLAAGSIVIRLNDGAEVTLYAPVRFSVLNSNHSELHHGQLSAEVPESAHGFEVLIPGGVVTDLGTSFQLYVADNTAPNPSHVQVSEGLVTVASRRSGRRGEPVALRRDQFATVSTDGEEVLAYEYTNEPVWIDVPSTGIGRRHAQADPDWTIRVNDQQREYAAVVVAPDDWDGAGFQHLTWLPGDARRSHWIALAPDGRTDLLGTENGSGTLTFQTVITIPDNFDPASIELRLRMLLDNQLSAIRVNGRKVAGLFSLPYPNRPQDALEQYQTWINHTLKDCFEAGENTIEFEVVNFNGPAGARIEMQCLGTQVYAPLDVP